MGSNGSGRGSKDGRQTSKPPPDSAATNGGSTSTGAFSKLDIVQKAFMAPFTHKKNDSTRILSERAYSRLAAFRARSGYHF